MPGKIVKMEDGVARALESMARDQMKSFQELSEEAFCDLLRKHGRPVDLKDALRRSAGAQRNSNARKKTRPKRKAA
jgi:non-homologous end joining protein Ku